MLLLNKFYVYILAASRDNNMYYSNSFIYFITTSNADRATNNRHHLYKISYI